MLAPAQPASLTHYELYTSRAELVTTKFRCATTLTAQGVQVAKSKTVGTKQLRNR
jgi:hypothetical protein